VTASLHSELAIYLYVEIFRIKKIYSHFFSNDGDILRRDARYNQKAVPVAIPNAKLTHPTRRLLRSSHQPVSRLWIRRDRESDVRWQAVYFYSINNPPKHPKIAEFKSSDNTNIKH